jgi:hypothetical protein
VTQEILACVSDKVRKNHQSVVRVTFWKLKYA